MPDLLWRAAELAEPAPDVEPASDGRTVDGRLVPYDTAATIPDDRYGTYTETWARGAAIATDPLLVYAWHDPVTGERGPTIGRAVATAQRDDGFHATLRVADTEAGRDVLALAREGLDGVSIEFAPHTDAWSDDHRAVTRQRAVVSAVAFAPRPAYPDARVLALRSQPEEEVAVPTLTPVEPDVPPDDDTPDDDDVRRATHLRSLADRHPAARTTALPAAAGQFRSFGEFALALAKKELDPRSDRAQLYFRALADEVSGDVAGLLPEQWIGPVVDLMASVSVTLNAFRQVALPASGNVFNFPRIDQYPDVGVQAVEKTDIATRKVLVSPVPTTLQTWAGGQDVSVVVTDRTDPSYITMVMNLYAKQMQTEINQAFAAALVAGAAAGGTWPAAITDLPGAITAAVLTIVNATYTHPSVAILGSNAWAQIVSATDTDGRPLYPSQAPSNPQGTANVTSASVNLMGLTGYHDPTIDPTVALIGIPDAAVSTTGPIQTLAADNPGKAGRDVAVYRFAAFGVVDPRGLVKLTGATAPAAAAQASKTSK
jgi:phage head maturation protease